MQISIAFHSCLLFVAVSLKLSDHDVAIKKGSLDDVLNYIEIGSFDGYFFANMATIKANGKWNETLLKNKTAKQILNVSTCEANYTDAAWNPITNGYTLPCQNFNKIMELAKFQHVHILSLDVGGAEFRFLDSLEPKVMPNIVIAELLGKNSTQDKLARQWFQKKGYTRSYWDITSICNESAPTIQEKNMCVYPTKSPIINDICMLGNEVYVLDGEGPQKMLSTTPAPRRMHLNCLHRFEAGESARRRNILEIKAVDSANANRQRHMQATSCSDKKVTYYSQGMEDMGVLNDYFCGIKGGTYVEIGALDGIHFSNSKMFEDSMNWTGVLIEANPWNAANIRVNRRGPPYNTIIPMGVCPEGVRHLTFLGGENNGTGGAVDTMAESHAKKWQGKHHSYQVPCKPIGKMLSEAGLSHVDFFSLDVEGAEFAVLQTMDWNITTCLFLVELDGQNETKDEDVRKLLKSKGYMRDKRFEKNLALTCQSMNVAHNEDCMLGNEAFVHETFDTCGVHGDSARLQKKPKA